MTATTPVVSAVYSSQTVSLEISPSSVVQPTGTSTISATEEPTATEEAPTRSPTEASKKVRSRKVWFGERLEKRLSIDLRIRD